jgi:3-phosphoshikimate 1-carboxyvinyltransferase
VIVPLTQPPHATVSVPGSKSITNRVLVLAALSARIRWGRHRYLLTGALRSEDTEVMVESLNRLGFNVRLHWDYKPPAIVVHMHFLRKRVIPAERADLYVANSGTTMRFLTAVVSVGGGRYRLDGVPRMRERPMKDLLDALGQLGVDAKSENGNGCPPVIISTNGWQNPVVRVKSDVSSQFLSGLLLAAPFANQDTEIMFDGPPVSKPYLDMTVAVMHAWGFDVRSNKANSGYVVPGRQNVGNLETYAIEPDASAASYFFGAAAVTGGRVTVTGLTKQSLQGDMRFVDVLERMGCRVEASADRITVEGGMLRGIDVDMNDISDTVMTLAGVACFAEGPTTIRNVAHIRHKETDRLTALATELRRIGAGVEEFADGLTITPRPLHGAEIETYNDHRMAMSMALVGLRVPGIVIKNPGCVAKTYPDFFADLERLRQVQ